MNRESGNHNYSREKMKKIPPPSPPKKKEEAQHLSEAATVQKCVDMTHAPGQYIARFASLHGLSAPSCSDSESEAMQWPCSAIHILWICGHCFHRDAFVAAAAAALLAEVMFSALCIKNPAPPPIKKPT